MIRDRFLLDMSQELIIESFAGDRTEGSRINLDLVRLSIEFLAIGDWCTKLGRCFAFPICNNKERAGMEDLLSPRFRHSCSFFLRDLAPRLWAEHPLVLSYRRSDQLQDGRRPSNAMGTTIWKRRERNEVFSLDIKCSPREQFFDCLQVSSSS